MDNFRRSRQFKMLLSTEEWYDLLSIADLEEKTISDVLRTFITRRAYDLRHPATQDIGSIADTLMDLSRKLRTVSVMFERHFAGFRPNASPRASAAGRSEWQASEPDRMVLSEEAEAAGGHPAGDRQRTDAHE